MLNQVTLVGRLTATPKTIETESGQKRGLVSIAVTRSYKNIEGIYETDFIECELWGEVATNAQEYCKQGDLVGIRGRIESKRTENGEEVIYAPYIVVERLTFLSSKPSRKEEEED